MCAVCISILKLVYRCFFHTLQFPEYENLQFDDINEHVLTVKLDEAHHVLSKDRLFTELKPPCCTCFPGALDGGKSRRSYVESADEMFARWENTSMDAESVVRDALIAGRIPAAVVQLHRMHSRAVINCSPVSQPRIVDVFKEVQEISKGIVYELLCKVSLNQKLHSCEFIDVLFFKVD